MDLKIVVKRSCAIYKPQVFREEQIYLAYARLRVDGPVPSGSLRHLDELLIPAFERRIALGYLILPEFHFVV